MDVRRTNEKIVMALERQLSPKSCPMTQRISNSSNATVVSVIVLRTSPIQYDTAISGSGANVIKSSMG